MQPDIYPLVEELDAPHIGPFGKIFQVVVYDRVKSWLPWRRHRLKRSVIMESRYQGHAYNVVFKIRDGEISLPGSLK